MIEPALIATSLAPVAADAWPLLVVAAIGLGISKSGFSGLSLVHVLVFAHVFGARASTGVVLPLLIVGDVVATTVFGKDVQWGHVRRMLPAAVGGVVIGWWLMGRIDEAACRPVVGVIILALATLQIGRMVRPAWLADVPHAWWFASCVGALVGITTMLANAAGPVFALFLLAAGVPKREFVATTAWFFLLLNLAKLPFSLNLGLIGSDTLLVNLLLVPATLVGLALGRAVVRRIPQRGFDLAVLALSALAAARMILP